ncbi:MAG: hypothetical protein V3T23_01660 [Nitrososphaerales archaeon]
MRYLEDGTYQEDLTAIRESERDLYAEDQDNAHEPTPTVECDICGVKISAEKFPPLCFICTSKVVAHVRLDREHREWVKDGAP